MPIPSTVEIASDLDTSWSQAQRALFIDIQLLFVQERFDATACLCHFERCEKENKPIVLLISSLVNLTFLEVREKLRHYSFSRLVVGSIHYVLNHPLFELNARNLQVRAYTDLIQQWYTTHHPQLQVVDIVDPLGLAPAKNSLRPKGPSAMRPFHEISDFADMEVSEYLYEIFTNVESPDSLFDNITSPAPLVPIRLILEFAEIIDIEIGDFLYETYFKTTTIENLSQVIFLDIDGVFYNHLQELQDDKAVRAKFQELYPDQTFDGDHMPAVLNTRSFFFHTESVLNLLKLFLVPHTGVVMSSNWRKYLSVRGFAYVMRFGDFIVDKTGEDERGRGFEIATWLHQNPTVSRYVVIDDTDSFLALFFPKNFVQVNPEQLFTAADRDKALACMTQVFE